MQLWVGRPLLNWLLRCFTADAADSVRRDDFFIAYRAVTTCSTILDLLVKLFGASERDYDLASSREARRKECAA
jgi:hypothetical protein